MIYRLILAVSLLLMQDTAMQPVKTIANLKKAYVDEANTAHQYDLFARKAEEEKCTETAKLFRALAQSETVHMQNHGKVLKELGQPLPQVTLENVNVRRTEDNLKVPIQNEKNGSESYYAKLISDAEAEHVPGAVASFTRAMQSERGHLLLLRRTLFDYNHLPETDYYVSAVTGEVLALPAGTSSTSHQLKDKSYVKVN